MLRGDLYFDVRPTPLMGSYKPVDDAPEYDWVWEIALKIMRLPYRYKALMLPEHEVEKGLWKLHLKVHNIVMSMIGRLIDEAADIAAAEDRYRAFRLEYRIRKVSREKEEYYKKDPNLVNPDMWILPVAEFLSGFDHIAIGYIKKLHGMGRIRIPENLEDLWSLAHRQPFYTPILMLRLREEPSKALTVISGAKPPERFSLEGRLSFYTYKQVLAEILRRTVKIRRYDWLKEIDRSITTLAIEMLSNGATVEDLKNSLEDRFKESLKEKYGDAWEEVLHKFRAWARRKHYGEYKEEAPTFEPIPY